MVHGDVPETDRRLYVLKCEKSPYVKPKLTNIALLNRVETGEPHRNQYRKADCFTDDL